MVFKSAEEDLFA